MTRSKRFLLGSCAAAALAGCGSVASRNGHDPDTTADASVDDAGVDATVDAADPPKPVRCAHDKPFGKPVLVKGIAAGAWTSARLSDDELTLYATGVLSGGTQNDVFVTRRGKRDQAFDLTAATKPLTTSRTSNDNFPTVSTDGKTLVFDSEDATLGRHLWIASRSTAGAAEFGKADPIQGDVAAGIIDSDPFLTADGTELWFSSRRADTGDDIDLFHAPKVAGGFGTAVHEKGLSSAKSDGIPVLSDDRLTLYFQSSRGGADGALGGFDIWTAHRSTVNDGWPAPTPVKELNSTATDWPGWLSSDQCRLYLTSDRDGNGLQVFVAERQP